MTTKTLQDRLDKARNDKVKEIIVRRIVHNEDPDIYKEFKAHEQAVLKLVIEEIEKLGNADRIHSKSQNKMIEPWTVEGCAVHDLILEQIKKALKSGSVKE